MHDCKFLTLNRAAGLNSWCSVQLGSNVLCKAPGGCLQFGRYFKMKIHQSCATNSNNSTCDGHTAEFKLVNSNSNVKHQSTKCNDARLSGNTVRIQYHLLNTVHVRMIYEKQS